MEYPHDGYITTAETTGFNPAGWTLHSGTLLVRTEEGSFTKVAPGICIVGFELDEDQVATMRPVKYASNGLDFMISPEQ